MRWHDNCLYCETKTEALLILSWSLRLEYIQSQRFIPETLCKIPSKSVSNVSAPRLMKWPEPDVNKNVYILNTTFARKLSLDFANFSLDRAPKNEN